MTSTGAARNWDKQINTKQWGKFSFLSQLLLIQAGFNLDQESISCLNGLEPEAKAASVVGLPGEAGMGGGLSVITPLHPGEGLADLHEGYSPISGRTRSPRP